MATNLNISLVSFSMYLSRSFFFFLSGIFCKAYKLLHKPCKRILTIKYNYEYNFELLFGNIDRKGSGGGKIKTAENPLDKVSS